MADPETVEDWLSLSRQHEEIAKAACESKTAAQQGYFHAVMAVECALKAIIWQNERFSDRPSHRDRFELHGHNIRVLRDRAGIRLHSTDRTGASWLVVLNSDRSQYYDPKPMPRKVARQMVEAAFGEFGVVTWIRSVLTSTA